MRTLTIHLDFGAINESEYGSQPGSMGASPFPFEVLGEHGQLLAEGVADSSRPMRVQLHDITGEQKIFVRLAVPNGRLVSRPATPSSPAEASVQFSADDLPGETWAKWALARSAPSKAAPKPLARLGSVWFRLWSHDGVHWLQSKQLPRSNSMSGSAARQVDFDLPEATQHLIQFGGTHVPWSFVALPPGRSRMFFTANPEPTSGSLPVKVVLTRFQPEAETLLEFMARDSMRAADSVSKWGPIATQLLHDKFEDPISAIIGAYFLLRIGRWKQTELQWFDNIYRRFAWSSDAALIRCAVSGRHGLSKPGDANRFLQQLRDCFARGVPLFEEGHRVLLEVHSIVASLSSEDDVTGSLQAQLVAACESLSSARVWAGSSFAFRGAHPDAPQAQPTKGPAPDDLSAAEEHWSADSLPELQAEVRLEYIEAFNPSTLIDRAPGRTGRPKRLKRRDVVYLKDL
ncbi:MAG: hypothetical protein NTX37_05240 [Burkholderiales bacterium]|nr:hypothetical protein [Burkholderiales bacterium]